MAKIKLHFIVLFLYSSLPHQAYAIATTNSDLYPFLRNEKVTEIEFNETDGTSKVRAGSWTTHPLLFDTTFNTLLTFKLNAHCLSLQPELLFNHFRLDNKGDLGFSLTNTLSYHYSNILFAIVSGSLYRRLTEPEILDSALFLGRSGTMFNQNNSTYDHISGAKSFDAAQSIAYLQLKTPLLEIGFGRRPLRWGPGYNGSLLFNGIVPLNCYYVLEKNIDSLFSLSAFFGAPDYNNSFFPERQRDSTKYAVGERYTAGHRAEVVIFKKIRIGLTEVVVCNGQREFNRYINPLQMYYLVSSNSDLSSNLLASGDFWAQLCQGIAIYGEFANDDITFFEKGNPDRYAYQIGGVYHNKSKNLTARVEYTYSKAYTYTHFNTSKNWYMWSNQTAGYWTGPDADHLYMHAEKKFDRAILRLSFNNVRKGEKGILYFWDRLRDGSGEDEPYLQGDIKTIQNVTISGNYIANSFLDFFALAGIDHRKKRTMPLMQIIIRVTY